MKLKRKIGESKSSFAVRVIALERDEAQAEIYAIKKEPCEWVKDEFFLTDGGFYETSCGGEFSLTDGTPEENNMKYCPFCGGLIEHKGE